jgi:hypothetical protein
MFQAVTQLAQPKWSIKPMTMEQIPLFVSWIAALDPRSEMDQKAIADRMQNEMLLARKIGFPEYYIGHFEQLPIFFMIGFLIEKKKM